MDVGKLWELRMALQQAVEAATDAESVRQLRDALVESGVLAVFAMDASPDLLDLLDAGGPSALRERLRGQSLAALREIIAARNYDPEKQTARWRSVNRLTDLIVAKAVEELAAELAAEQAQPAPLAAASWML